MKAIEITRAPHGKMQDAAIVQPARENLTHLAECRMAAPSGKVRLRRWFGRRVVALRHVDAQS